MRLAQPAGCCRVTAAPNRVTTLPPRLSLIIACLFACSCARQTTGSNSITAEMTIQPAPPVVGAATRGTVTLRDGAGRPVRGATLQVQGFMSHPGMAPLVAAATERGDGIYEVTLQFTMAGDWTLRVAGALPDGPRLTRDLLVATARPPG